MLSSRRPLGSLHSGPGPKVLDLNAGYRLGPGGIGAMLQNLLKALNEMPT